MHSVTQLEQLAPVCERLVDLYYNAKARSKNLPYVLHSSCLQSGGYQLKTKIILLKKSTYINMITK